MVDWEIAYHDVWCGDQGKISDTAGTEPNIGLNECQRRCLNQVQCKFILHGIDVWYFTANRCALFRTCDDRTEYLDNHPSVYRRPSQGKNQSKGIAKWRFRWSYIISLIRDITTFLHFIATIGWKVVLGGKTKLTGIHVNENFPIAAIISYRVKGNIYIVAAMDDFYLKMVKIRITGETTFDWLTAKYRGPSSMCTKQITFSEECFYGTGMPKSSYNVQLLAEKISGTWVIFT